MVEMKTLLMLHQLAFDHLTNLHFANANLLKPQIFIYSRRKLDVQGEIYDELCNFNNQQLRLFHLFSSTLKCGCQWPLQPCALCTGRPDPTAPRDLPDTLPTTERVALLDPGFHPVLSFPDGKLATNKTIH